LMSAFGTKRTFDRHFQPTGLTRYDANSELGAGR
jgi:hypothetical protein